MPTKKVLFITFCTILLSSQASFATEFIPECQDINYVSQNVDVVVSGEVIKSEAKLVKRTIFTYIDIKVKKYFKGDGGDIITIKQFGGTINGKTQAIAGSPKFTVGQTGYLYLNKTKDETKFYNVFCGYGMTDILPTNFKKSEQ
jgi:hypothetical protein